MLHILTSSVLAHAARDRASQLARLAKDPHSAEVRPLLGEAEKPPVTAEDESLIPAEFVLGSDGLGTDGESVAAAPHDDPRTMDQARADVMIDLLLAAAVETVTASGAEAVQGGVSRLPRRCWLERLMLRPNSLDAAPSMLNSFERSRVSRRDGIGCI